MDEKNVLLFVSFWISLFILFMGMSSNILCFKCLVMLDKILVVLLCSLLSFECGKVCVSICEELKNEK